MAHPRTRTVAALALALVAWLPAAARPEAPTRAEIPVGRGVVVGLERGVLCATVMVAEAKGDLPPGVSVRWFQSGRLALQAMLAGEVDLAVASDTAIAIAAFERQDFRVLATVGQAAGDDRVVARRDRAIAVPADLRGKRIATQRGSAVHFFQSLFLAKHGLDERSVVQVFLPPDELVPALRKGEVDAITMREPYVGMAGAALGEDAVVFSAPAIDRRVYRLLASGPLLREGSEVVVGVLAALLRAEEALRRDPEEGRRIVAARMGTAPAVLAATWGELRLSTSLEQAVFRSLENQARWAVRARLVPGRTFPDFLALVDPGPLEAVDRRRVSIVR